MDKTSVRERVLASWGVWAARNWVKTLIITAVLSSVVFIGFTRLKLEMTFFSIMPGESEQVQSLETIMTEFPFASQIMLVVDGREISDPVEAEKSVKGAADALAAAFSDSSYKHSNDIVGADSRFDLEFYRKYGLLLTKPDDLERMKKIYRDVDLVPFLEGLNNDFEREYAGDEDNMKDDEALLVSQIRGLETILSRMEQFLAGSELSIDELEQTVDSYLLGDSYFLSNNRRMAIVIIRPNFTIDDIEKLVSVIPDIDRQAAEIGASYNVTTGLTGLIVVGKDEMVTAQQGLGISTTIALALIIALMILVFRMNSVPLITGIPLVVGILWTAGLTGFIIHRLNLMTAMYLVALLGLGIDYAIHLLTVYVQEREAGLDFFEAVSEGFKKSGSGIIIGGLTTACAFFALTVSKNGLMRELGLVAGMGILAELAAMMVLLPALMGLRHSWLQKRNREDSILHRKIKIRIDPTRRIGFLVSQNPWAFLIVLAAAGILLSMFAGRVEIQSNMMKMEAKGLRAVELQDEVIREFGMAPDGLNFLSGNLDEIRNLHERLEDLESVKTVDSIAPYFPSEDQQKKRRPFIRELHEELEEWESSEQVDPDFFIDEIYRLEMNLLEMGDLAFFGGLDRAVYTLNEITGRNGEGVKIEETVFDRIPKLIQTEEGLGRLLEFQDLLSGEFHKALLSMSQADRLKQEDLPRMATDSFISRDGEHYLMTMNPRQNAWEGEFRNVYTTQIATVTDRATGMILVCDQLISMAETDGLRAAIAALIACFVVLLLDFRNLKLTLITFVPLLLSFGSLFGLMALTGIKFDFINIIAIPLLIGIGIDDAVHINHRYLLEGEGKMETVVAKTGSAVFLTSVTTMVGFGSFIPAVMRAMQSTGIVLVMAIGLAFVFSILLHPSLLIITVEKAGWNIRPWDKQKKENER
jgi:uncharacterized protein